MVRKLRKEAGASPSSSGGEVALGGTSQEAASYEGAGEDGEEIPRPVPWAGEAEMERVPGAS